jgi:hypothetical protein
MNTIRASLLACAGCLAITAASASASVDEYSVGANSALRINLVVCSAETQLAVQGNGGTDLDFIVTDPSGTAVHSDQGIDDYLSVVLDKNGGDCATFGLAVSNLGEESNTFQVVLEPINEASTRVEKYIIGPSATETVNFKACGTSAQLIARGDGDTDLDFIVRNSDGGVVHEDVALEDETTATLAGLLSDCETFEMEVSNLGAVYNALMVMVAPEGASDVAFTGTAPSTSLASGLTGVSTVAETEGAGEYRADANSSITVNLPVCGVNRLAIRGDGDTDLDFTVNDSTGNTVHSDFDLSDVTFATLTPSLQECETFTVDVSNLGDVYNVFSIALTDENDLGGVSGAGEYRINATSSSKVMMRVCESTMVYARGDGDTDLDFDITDGSGNSVHSDYDLTDQTEFTLDPGGVCSDFQMSISNLGDVYNVLTVAFDEEPDIARSSEPAGVARGTATATAARPSTENSTVVGTGPGEYRAPANETVVVSLPVCDRTFLSVEGDGDTDLDYQVISGDGTVVHSDYDLTDVTYTSLSPSGGCETFSLTIENLGGVYNVFTVGYNGGGAAFDAAAGAEAAADAAIVGTSISVPEDTISRDGNNRNIAVLNRTGEALNFIYWTNSATLGWGEDKLGDSSVLAAGQQWNVYGGDGSDACLFDFRAITAGGREIAFRQINVCEVTSVTFE